jgi:DNA-binding IclR family transcriptional regulator
MAETIDRAISILDAFLEGPAALTLTAIAERTGLHKTTALRLCTSLESHGLLVRGGDLTFRLGPKAWLLGQAFSRTSPLENTIRPLLQEIVDTVQESASFYVRHGDRRTCLFRVNSPHTVRHHLNEGASFPVEMGVTGRVMLAYAGEPGEEFDKIRADGYLIDEGREPYTTSVSMPVLVNDEHMIGTLVVSGVTTRFSEESRLKALELVKRAVAKIAHVAQGGIEIQPAQDKDSEGHRRAIA